MPLFTVGNFNQIGISFDQPVMMTRAVSKGLESRSRFEVAVRDTVSFPRTLPTEALRELSFNVEPPTMNLTKSKRRWGLSLNDLYLNKSFEGFIKNIFHKNNQVYFTTITWDYSGDAPFTYPPKGVQSSSFQIPIKPKTKYSRLFIGNGVDIWPSKIVVGALNIVIIVYESDDDVRKVGETLVDIHDKVGSSNLAGLISAISTNPSLVTESVVKDSVAVLMDAIGIIMKRNGDDYVDLFEGSYRTDTPQLSRKENYNHESAGIELNFTVS